jgi:fatty acid desaturase
MKLFTYTKWDALPVASGLLHCAYVLTLFFIFPYAPWWLLICMGFIYSISISWNMNGISHNHIHNPYFTSRILNRLYSILLNEAAARSAIARNANNEVVIGIMAGL